MLGVGAGAPAPPLVRAPPPPPVAGAVAAPRLPPLFPSPPLRRRRPSVAAKQKQGGRRWWSDSPEQEEEEEEYDDFLTDSSSFGGELFDEPWFSKVFKTYGFLLPVMLASMLVATGPKAFLMVMAIPLAQSAVSFLLDAIWGRNGRRTRPFQEEEDEEEEDDFPQYSSDFANRSSSYDYGGRRRPQSTAESCVSDDFVASAENDYYSTKKGRGDGKSGSFGGWDELLDKDDDAGQDQFASKKDAGQATGRTRRAAAGQGPGAPPLSRRISNSRPGRMSAGNKYKQAPLLMRLMVALFPFLGSWFRLL